MYDLLGILVILIWSFAILFLKQMMAYANGNYVILVVAYNFVAAIIALFISYYIGELKQVLLVNNRKKLVVLIFLNGLYDVFIAAGVFYCVVVQYAVIGNYLWPALTVLFLAKFKKQTLSRNAVLGCIICFTAVLVTSVQPHASSLSQNSVGISLSVIAAILWSSYSALLDKEHANIPIALQGIAHVVSFIVASMWALATGYFKFSDIANTNVLVLIIVYSSIIMVLGYALWIRVVVRHAKPQIFLSTVYALPILSILWTTLWFGEAYNPRIWIATLLLVVGISISRMSSENKARQGDTKI